MLADIFIVAWKEIKELPYLRRDKSRTNFFTLILFVGVFGIFLPLQTGKDWVTSPLNLLYWAWLPFMLVGTTMVDAFAGERERHTLETLLASRLSDRAILFGKILAGVIYGLAMTFMCILLGLATVNVAFGRGSLLFFPAGIGLGILAVVLLISTLASGLGVLVSLRAGSVRQAQQTFTIAYFVLFIPLMLLPMLPATVMQPVLQFLMHTDFTTIAIGAGLIVVLLDVALILAAMARFKRARLILD
jgi:ABC-2 type transport system permease protein